MLDLDIHMMCKSFCSIYQSNDPDFTPTDQPQRSGRFHPGGRGHVTQSIRGKALPAAETKARRLSVGLLTLSLASRDWAGQSGRCMNAITSSRLGRDPVDSLPQDRL
jgi:hypothetical protein